MAEQHLGEYRTLKSLASGTVLCLDSASRKTILKKLEPDCLLRGQLHPAIKDRLGRVRELAQKQVATLRSVERIADAAWLVWDYVEGETFSEHIAAGRDPRRIGWLMRELILCVESLHMRGIVHGAIHWRNVIVTPRGEIQLTHISPLLYNDPADDAEAIVRLLEEVVKESGGEGSPLGKVVRQSDVRQIGLRELGKRLAGLMDVSDHSAPLELPRSERCLRAGAVVAAVAAAMLGIGVGVAIYHQVARQSTTPVRDFGRLDQFPATR